MSSGTQEPVSRRKAPAACGLAAPAASPAGPAVVLVADRTLSAAYRVLFEGIFATMQTTQVPSLLMRGLLSPRQRTDAAGRALAAPLGIRRVESSLVAAGLDRRDVACTTPEALPRIVGPATRVVCFSSSDPLGLGMSNTTTRHFQHGKLYTREWTRRLLERLRALKQRHGFAVIAGGAGAWQWRREPAAAERLGVDCVYEGYFEAGGGELVRDALAGHPLPAHRSADGCATDRVAPILAPSTMGVVELSRGCGRGCRFCASAREPMAHLPADTILADLEANLAGGVRSVVNGSEDFFRYGGSGAGVDFPALHALLERMRQLEGLSFMQLDHANVTSVLQLDADQLREIRRLLTWSQPSEYLWVNLGIESANGELVARSARGKIAPYDPADWESMVRQAADRLSECGYFPVFSLVLGLPGETADDVRRTLRLVRDLARKPCVVFPVFHEPIDDAAAARGEAFGLDDMTADHLELFRTCYEINFRRVPPLVWDNQRAGGVSWLRRSAIQALGRGEVKLWRHRFRRLGRRIARRDSVPAAPAAASELLSPRERVAAQRPGEGLRATAPPPSGQPSPGPSGHPLPRGEGLPDAPATTGAETFRT